MDMQFIGILRLLPFLIFASGNEIPQDVLALIEPGMGLEILEQKSDPASLEKLILSGLGGDDAPVGGRISKAAENAIQNLASRSEKVRDKARAQLVAEGPRAIKRLEEVVASDPRRAREARKAITEIQGERRALRHGESLARILAIREAAAKKHTKLVPALRKAAGSKDHFVRLAAEESLVRLDKTYKPAASSPGHSGFRMAEIEALPTGVRIALALQIQEAELGKSAGLTIQGYAEKMLAFLPVGGEEQMKEQMRQVSGEILTWVKSYGNMRPSRALLVNAAPIGERSGGMGIILQGLYEPEVIRKTLNSSPLWTKTEVSGHTLYNSPFLRLVLLSDRSVLLLPTVASTQFPIKEYLKNLSEGKKPLRSDKRLARFLGSLDDKMIVRGLLVNDDKLLTEDARTEIEGEFERELPEDVFKAFQSMKEVEITAAVTSESKKRVRFEAEFSGSKAPEVVVGFVRGKIQEGIIELETKAKEMAGFPPFPRVLQTMAGILKAIKLSAESKKVILRFDLPELKLEELLAPLG